MILDRPLSPRVEQYRQDESDSDSLSSGSTSTSSLSNESEYDRLSIKDIRLVLNQIYEQIISLYSVSRILRRPVVRDKYIRSSSRNANVSCYIEWDQAHVREKFCGASETLVCRLGIANTRRREQLRFWKEHGPGDSKEVSAIVSKTPSLETSALTKDGARQYHGDAGSKTVSALTESKGPTSRVTKQSFSTVALSALNENETSSNRPKTVYEPSMQGSGRSLRVPDPPRVPFGRHSSNYSFQCPYCLQTLNAQTMRQRQAWK